MNIVSIRQKVIKAIQKAPKTIQVFRTEKVDDGAGGYIESTVPTLVAECDGILNNSSNSSININVSAGGMVSTTGGITFITVYQEGTEFRTGDFFTLDGIKYVIKNPVNILHLNIYWEIQVEQVVGG